MMGQLNTAFAASDAKMLFDLLDVEEKVWCAKGKCYDGAVVTYKALPLDEEHYALKCEKYVSKVGKASYECIIGNYSPEVLYNALNIKEKGMCIDYFECSEAGRRSARKESSLVNCYKYAKPKEENAFKYNCIFKYK